MINEHNAKSFCKEDISKIENYDKAIADNTQMWHCHHRTEIWWNCSRKDLIENECYYNRKACELIFLTPAEHCKIHNKGRHLSEDTKKKISDAHKGLRHSEESRKKMSESRKGKNNPMYGGNGSFLGKHHSEESKRKMSESHKGINKGKKMSLESRRKMSEAKKCNVNKKGKTNSVFGSAFKEHYGITLSDDIKLYKKEYNFYRYHGKFSWEV